MKELSMRLFGCSAEKSSTVGAELKAASRCSVKEVFRGKADEARAIRFRDYWVALAMVVMCECGAGDPIAVHSRAATVSDHSEAVTAVPPNSFDTIEDGLVVSGESGQSLVVDQTHVYWLTDGTLFRLAKLDGKLQRVEVSSHVLVGLAQDANRIYLSTGQGGALYAVTKRKLVVTRLSPNVGHGRNIAVDRDYIYWTSYGDVVRRIGKRGETVDVVATGQHDSEDIYVDESSVYWNNTGPRGAGNFADLMVSDKTSGLVKRLFDDCSAMVGDRTSIYCAGYNAIWRVDKLDGRTARLTPVLSERPYALALDPDHVYWSSLGSGGARWINGKLTGSDGGAVMFVSKTGGQPILVARGLTQAYALAVDNEKRLWWRDARGISRISLNPESQYLQGNSQTFQLQPGSARGFETEPKSATKKTAVVPH
jgi:hypothetical protein